MAFVKDKTGSAQTAANASAVVVAAFAEQFPSFSAAVKAFHELRAEVFEDLAAIVDADNALFAANDTGAKPSGGKTYEKKERTSKTRSASKSKGGGGGSITLDDALTMTLNYGAFEGETLADVLKLSADDCDDDYGYGDGERDGRDYIAWLASDRNKNDFVQRRARIIADEEGISYDD